MITDAARHMTGAELNAVTQQPQTADERARKIVQAISRMAPAGLTTVLVTHGAFANRLGRLLIGREKWDNFAYGELAELACASSEDCGAGRWHVVGERWAPAGSSGRSRVA